ncbi:MAG: DsbA family oxidoreductase [Solirubrobacterales bacterium]|nr:DsbA family oxidoreductase [Solirubrobacterales bacterium]
MKAEIFSDIACPFCYIGTRRFAEALSGIPDRDGIEVVWRSFQLDPTAERRAEGDLLDHLTRKFGISRDEARAMNDRVIAMGHESGIEFDFESAFSVNTFDAHRMLQLAAAEGDEALLADRFFGAYFTGSDDLSDPAALARLATEAGVDADRARQVAEGDEFATEVRGDQELAGLLGITGVPAFVFDRSTAISGAQPVEVMREAILRSMAADS